MSVLSDSYYIVLCLFFAVSFTSESEIQLLEHLFAKYKPEARPVLKDSDAVDVKLGMTISQIIDVVCFAYCH